jgi:hypothetical protein
MNKAHVKTAAIAALSATVLLTGCGKNYQNTTLVEINKGDGQKDTISLAYGNFVARYEQAMYDQFLLGYYGEDMWQTDMSGMGTTMEDDTKANVLQEVKEMYLAKEHAGDYGIKLTKENKTAIAEAAEKFMSDNTEEALKEMGATKELVQEYLEYKTYYTLVSEAGKKEADKDITDEDCWMRTFSYVVFETNGKTDENGKVVDLSEEELTDLKAKAKALSQTADFDADVESLGLSKSSYSYHKGEQEDETMPMDIIKAAEALSEGGVSQEITVDGAGIYVLRLDKDHDEDASKSKRGTLQSEAFGKVMETWKGEIDWTVNEKAWAKVKFDKLFKAPVTEADEQSEATEEAPAEEATEEAPEEAPAETPEENPEATEEGTEATEGTEEAAEEAPAEGTEESDAN